MFTVTLILPSIALLINQIPSKVKIKKAVVRRKRVAGFDSYSRQNSIEIVTHVLWAKAVVYMLCVREAPEPICVFLLSREKKKQRRVDVELMGAMAIYYCHGIQILSSRAELGFLLNGN